VALGVTPALVQDYRIHRHEDGKGRHGTIPTRSTMHKDIVTLRQVLKSAMRNGWLDHMPDLSEPYRTSGKISHRAWLSPEEYKQLYEATRRRVENPPKKRWKSSCEQAHDYVLFMANTGLRPDEASRLEFRDVSIVTDDATKQTILEIKMSGKRGTGYCKSTKTAAPLSKYYASHIASSLDAAAINVRRPRKRKKGETNDDDKEEEKCLGFGLARSA
jgi:integrase